MGAYFSSEQTIPPLTLFTCLACKEENKAELLPRRVWNEGKKVYEYVCAKCVVKFDYYCFSTFAARNEKKPPVKKKPVPQKDVCTPLPNL